MRSLLVTWTIALALPIHAQPGPPPDEYVDVTGDGAADLLITSRTIPISDPQQPGYLGLIKVGVRTLSGTSVLMWSTPSNQRWFTLDSGAQLDTAELAARVHFKQVHWTDQHQATEFWLLERPFGPAITSAQDGWYGTGDHHDGNIMVLRSMSARGTSIAAFQFMLPYPYGQVVIDTKEALAVPNGYGDEGDAPKPRSKTKTDFDFGDEDGSAQVLVPPGLPPDEAVDVNDDGVIDVVIHAEDEHGHGGGEPGYFVRGIVAHPGTSLLMTNARWGTWGPFTLDEGATLTPERLATGLYNATLRWASPEKEPVFIELLRHPHDVKNMPIAWSATPFASAGHLVYRTTSYGRAYIGALEVVYTLPGGELGVRPQAWVEEGGTLEVR